MKKYVSYLYLGFKFRRVNSWKYRRPRTDMKEHSPFWYTVFMYTDFLASTASFSPYKAITNCLWWWQVAGNFEHLKGGSTEVLRTSHYHHTFKVQCHVLSCRISDLVSACKWCGSTQLCRKKLHRYKICKITDNKIGSFTTIFYPDHTGAGERNRYSN
jgi:hypothetical protein